MHRKLSTTGGMPDWVLSLRGQGAALKRLGNPALSVTGRAHRHRMYGLTAHHPAV
ncbi:MAG: hypothetical protein Q8R10_15835 [Pseudomonas sp.]|uniref:hypothetical protein n=1 Tax=Pseudomonas sp. TaxID=306 RepID=UPI002736689D|nr:hypothetical protein [Pseudomonas sp.]MDP3847887.1 hypothetical protein [Pseudomonas sp.]